MTALDEFSIELQRPNPLPERLALAIAGIAYPNIDIEYHLEQIDQLAARVADRLDDHQNSDNRAEQFIQIFCEELGFRGNRDDYYHPDNSYLNIVLEERRGLPIMLCLLCVALGRRINLPVEGVGFPGHFMASMQDAAGNWLLDPFHGKVIPPEEATSYLSTIFGVQPTLDASSFQAVSPAAWAQRILFNLRNVYLSRQETEMSVRVLDFLLVLMPRHPVLWRERGLLNYQNQSLQESIRDLRHSFFLFGQFAFVWGDEDQRQALLKNMGGEERRAVALYQNMLELLGKLN